MLRFLGNTISAEAALITFGLQVFFIRLVLADFTAWQLHPFSLHLITRRLPVVGLLWGIFYAVVCEIARRRNAAHRHP